MRNKLRYLPRLGMAEAQRLYGLTARALRFYEERGLLKAYRDRANCRYFDGEARQRLAWISALRAAGIPLLDVREVLQRDTDADRRQAALTKLELRREEIAQQHAAVEALGRALAAGPEFDADLGRADVLTAA